MKNIWFNAAADTSGDTECPCAYSIDCYKQNECNPGVETFDNTGDGCPSGFETTPPTCVSQTCYTGACNGNTPISTTNMVVEGTACASGSSLTAPNCSTGPVGLGGGGGGMGLNFSSGFSDFTGRRDESYLYKNGLWLNDNN
tara:strand:- start:4896 stop:5321 length:426 start_codon:yes stop_codon:yes gene_type:complete